jgi:molybdenum cofactor guanylyltransferase
MGRDKALLPFRGEPLASSIARAVEAAAGSAALIGDAALLGNLGYRVVPDRFPGEGPLGGVITALLDTSADWNLLVACDMPELTAAFLRSLLDAAQQWEADVLMPAGPSGLPEPLCAVYRRSAAGALEQAFAGGIRKITAAFTGLRTVRIPVPEWKPLLNVNTPEDWAGYAAG